MSDMLQPVPPIHARYDQTKECSEQVSSTPSVGMNLARRFNRGAPQPAWVEAPDQVYKLFPSRSDD